MLPRDRHAAAEVFVGSRTSYLMGIDSGTQSTTVCVWSAAGRRVARASAPLAVRSPHPGWAEQDPRQWWASTRTAIREALRNVPAARIAAVGVAYQRETFTLVDKRGRFLRPGVLWLDVRSSAEVERISRDIGRRRYHAATGKPLDITSALARLLWLRRHEPSCLRSAAMWMDVGGHLAQRLTGRCATCTAGTDTCGLIGLKRRDWIDAHLHCAGLKRRQLPELVEPGEVIGRLSRSAARRTHLPEGLPVVAAGGDGQVFSVGTGAAAPYQMSLTLGTSIVLGLSCPRPIVSPLFRTLIAASPGYLLESVLQAGTYLLRWFVDRFGGAAGTTEAAWDRRVGRVPPGCEGLVTLPNWWGVRFPETLPEARGVTLGWSDHHTPAHFYRSLLEGTSFELRRLMGQLRAMLPRRVRRSLRAGGGGARSKHWPQMLADVTGSAIELIREPEATALGAAILAGVGIGVFEDVRSGCARMCRVRKRLDPDAALRRFYGRLYRDVYSRLLGATADLSQSLRRICKPPGT